MLKVTAVVEHHEKCPLYKRGDALEFVPPAVQGALGVPVCAMAVETLNKIVPRLQGGLGPTAFQRTFCGGCSGKAWFNFDVARIAGGDEAAAQSYSQIAMGALTKLKFFAGVPAEQLSKILPLLRAKRIAEGEEIIRKGERAKGLHIIVVGECDVLTYDENKVENVLATLRGGECFGEISLITGDSASATVRAKSPGSLLWIGVEDFSRVLAQIPTLALTLARILAVRLSKASTWVTEELKKGIIGKLEMISPAELVQAMNVNSLTGSLVVQNETKSALIYFHGGQVREVDLSGKIGEEAFYEFLTWARGSFRFEPNPKDPGTRALQLDTTALLLEGMRRIDEYKATGVWRKPPPAEAPTATP